MKQVKATRPLWFIACDANVCPEDFEKSLWFQGGQMFIAAPKEASTCRSKGPKGEWLERTCDLVIACHNLRVKFHRWRWWKTLSGGHTKQCPLSSRETRRCRNGMSRRCPKHCLATVEGGCQEETQKKKAEKKRRKRRTAERDKSGMKSLKKWLRSAREEAKPTAQRTVGQSVEHNWDCSQIRMISWRRFWSGGEWTEFSWQAEAVQKVPKLVAHERMSQHKKVEG